MYKLKCSEDGLRIQRDGCIPNLRVSTSVAYHVQRLTTSTAMRPVLIDRPAVLNSSELSFVPP